MRAKREAGTRGGPDAQAPGVLELLARVRAWEPFRGPTGAALWRIPGAEGATYTVAPTSCTCPRDRYGHAEPCKHRRALAIYLAVAADIARRQPRPPTPEHHI